MLEINLNLLVPIKSKLNHPKFSFSAFSKNLELLLWAKKPKNLRIFRLVEN